MTNSNILATNDTSYNLEEMGGKELVAAINTLGVLAHGDEFKTVTRVASRAAGIKRLRNLHAEVVSAEDDADFEDIGDAPFAEPFVPFAEETEEAEESDIDEILAEPNFDFNCPHCDVHLSNGVALHGDEVNDHEFQVNEKYEVLCLGCGNEFGQPIKAAKPKSSVARSEGIADSWRDEEVRAKRCKRDGVRVISKTRNMDFRSVRQAFLELDLPLKEHIKFRMELKAAGELNRYDLQWKII